MKLEEGSTAIDFTATDIHGNSFSLSDFRGRKIILSFMRNVTCPFCNVRVHRLMGNSVRLEKSGVQMILIFESAPEKIKRSVLHEGLSRWPLIGDPENVYYKKYDIEHSVVKMLTTYLSIDTYKNLQEARKLDTEKKRDTSTSRTLLPADFFIDENFKIVRAYYGKNIDDHVDLEELKQFAIGKPKQRV